MNQIDPQLKKDFSEAQELTGEKNIMILFKNMN